MYIYVYLILQLGSWLLHSLPDGVCWGLSLSPTLSLTHTHTHTHIFSSLLIFTGLNYLNEAQDIGLHKVFVLTDASLLPRLRETEVFYKEICWEDESSARRRAGSEPPEPEPGSLEL